ncbi:hypothetical protein ACHAW6_002803 [Cyclotella cf. meneghiniana]
MANVDEQLFPTLDSALLPPTQLVEEQALTSDTEFSIEPINECLPPRPTAASKPLPPSTVDYLNDWLTRHSSNPYPTRTQKDALMTATGLDNEKLSKWFKRARARRGLIDRTLRNKGKPLPDSAIQHLQNWFVQHSDHPYPSQQDKQTMAELTGLTVTQIVYWFENTRQKRKKAQGNESTIRLPPAAIQCLEKWMQHHSHNPYPNNDQKTQLLEQTGLNRQQLGSWLERARARQRNSSGTNIHTRCNGFTKKNKLGNDEQVAVDKKRGSLEGCTRGPAKRRKNIDDELESTQVKNQNQWTTVPHGTIVDNNEDQKEEDKKEVSVGKNHKSPEGWIERPAITNKDTDDTPKSTQANLHLKVEEQKKDTNEHINHGEKFRYNGDYLMNWIAEHSSNPYPTRDEKEQLMALTGLSATQLNNWLYHTRKKLGIVADEYKAERLPQSSVDCLRNWFQEHSSFPYPTEEEREELLAATGLSRVQLSKWLGSARAKRKEANGDKTTSTIKARPPQDQQTLQSKFPPSAVDYLKNWLDEHSSYPYPTRVERETILADTGLNRNQLVAWFKRERVKHGICAIEKKPENFPPSAKCYLKDWFAKHASYPYPTDEEKVAIKEATGLNATQVASWFVKERMRHKQLTGKRIRSKRMLPRSSMKYIEQWVVEHSSNPYTTKEEKKAIMAATGLSAELFTKGLSYARRKLTQAAGKKSSRKIATDYLKNWLDEHSNLFPTNEEKKSLAISTGMSETQVANWFQNTRAKQKVTLNTLKEEKVAGAFPTKEETKAKKEISEKQASA